MNMRQAIKIDLETVKNITYETIQTIYPHYYPKGAVGTVTIKGIEICRLFVLPHYQRNGYGRALLEFAEKYIWKESKKIRLDASLPAKEIYLNRGYKEIEFHSIVTLNGDYLCYDVMDKNSNLLP